MKQDKQQLIADALRAEKCPECGRRLPPAAERVGSGALADGVFCGLGCQAAFHKEYFRERARASDPSQN